MWGSLWNNGSWYNNNCFLLFPVLNKLLHNSVIIIGVAFNVLSKDEGGIWVAAAADGGAFLFGCCLVLLFDGNEMMAAGVFFLYGFFVTNVALLHFFAPP